MTETPNTGTGKTDETAKPAVDTDIARKIWLAGVGAYDRIRQETQGAVEKIAHTATETFEELVAKGEEVEDSVRKSLSKSPQLEKMKTYTEEQRAALETRLGKVRETLAETLAPWNVPSVNQSLEKLAAQVEALTKEVASLKAEKSPTTPTAD